jgi:hypothetical protein
MITMDHGLIRNQADDAHKAVTDRTFGLLLAGISAVLGAWPLLRARPARLWWFAISIGLALVATACPGLLSRIKTIWFAVATRIAMVVTFVLLSVIFFAVVTPVGVFFRLIGRDTMGRRYDAKATTYWKMREAPEAVAEGMRHQF